MSRLADQAYGDTPITYPDVPGHVAGSDTSKSAAASVTGSAGALRGTVLHKIKDAGPSGLTCDEIEAILGGRHQTISARVRELVMFGKIRDSQVRRATRSGRSARVYLFVQE
jgi:hypothetical protein